MNTGSYLPPDPYHEHDRLRRGELLTRAAMYAGIALLCGIIVGAIAMRAFNASYSSPADALRSPPTITIATGPTVLNAIKQQAKLETVSMRFSLDKSVARVSGIANVCSEKLTYLGYFNATAGIDLSRIETQNVIVTNDGYPDKADVVVTLPPAEIMHVEMDTKKSRIVAQETPQWIPGCTRQLPEMTTEAQDDLRTKAEEAAKSEGILPMAQERAGFEVRRLLLNAGYKNVTIKYAPGQEPQGVAPIPSDTGVPTRTPKASAGEPGILNPPDPDVKMTPTSAAKRKPKPIVKTVAAPRPKGVLSVAVPIAKVKEKPTVIVAPKPAPPKRTVAKPTRDSVKVAARKTRTEKRKNPPREKREESLTRYVQ